MFFPQRCHLASVISVQYTQSVAALGRWWEKHWPPIKEALSAKVWYCGFFWQHAYCGARVCFLIIVNVNNKSSRIGKYDFFAFFFSALDVPRYLNFCIFPFSRVLIFFLTVWWHLPNVLLKTFWENFRVTKPMPLCYQFENELSGLIVDPSINGQYREGFLNFFNNQSCSFSPYYPVGYFQLFQSSEIHHIK